MHSLKQRLFASIILFCALAIPAGAQLSYTMEQPVAKRQVRGVWLTTLNGLDWPKSKATNATSMARQQAELIDMLNKLQAVGINTVFFQARIRGSVAYPSKIEPWDAAFSGKYDVSPGYDPLAFAINECHRRGMELHAWVVAVPAFKQDVAKKMSRRSLLHTHPSLLKKHNGQYCIDPGLPGSAEYVSSICAEIVDNYDVDGIHLDYIRYPDKPDAFADASTFKKYGAKQTKAHWRRANITRMVQAIHSAVKQRKPWVRLSCSPVGKHDNVARYSAKGWSAQSVYQDAQAWLKQGIMDMLCPMMYFRDNDFYPFAADWQEQSHGRTIVPGLGLYQIDAHQKDWPMGEMARQLAFIRQENLQGEVYFRARFLTDNVKGFYDYLADHVYTTPTLMPAMTWHDSTPPAAPQITSRQRVGAQRETIQWQSVEDNGAPCRYAIYASRTSPVDIENARHLVAITYSPSYTYNLLTSTLYGLHLAITAIDRFGNESEAVEL